MTRGDICRLLWGGHNPFAAARQLPYDAQGWYSEHPFLIDAADQCRNGVLIEVGAWKGASALYMAQRMRDTGTSGTLIAVDTWLGSAEHWLGQVDPLPLHADGRNALYDTFLSNVLIRGMESHIVPLPLDSVNAARVLAGRGIIADAVHIDAGHEHASALADIRSYWSLLASGGTMIVDDYRNGAWPGVTAAVDDFLGTLTKFCSFETSGNKCRFRKL